MRKVLTLLMGFVLLYALAVGGCATAPAPEPVVGWVWEDGPCGGPRAAEVGLWDPGTGRIVGRRALATK